MNSSRITTANITEVAVQQLADALSFYFDQDVPTPVINTDWEKARVQLAYYGNIYSTLCGYLAMLNVAIRRTSKASAAYVDLASKRDLVTEAKDAIGRKYDTISRMFTLYAEEKGRQR